MEKVAEKSIGEIVAEDYRTAQVFKDHKIDFCCNGNRSLSEVAKESKLDVQKLRKEVDAVKTQKAENGSDFESWPLDLLSTYIVKTHHRRAEKEIQVLKPYLEKICQVHGTHHPELLEIKQIFNDISGEMSAHMKKEELILFPFIEKLVKVQNGEMKVEDLPSNSVENPVDMMTHEHDDQGNAFKRIAALSDDYTPPSDACNTYRVTFGLLSDFEDGLHKHIHLENNILFPKSVHLEKELTA